MKMKVKCILLNRFLSSWRVERVKVGGVALWEEHVEGWRKIVRLKLYLSSIGGMEAVSLNY